MGLVKSRININKELASLFNTHSLTLSCSAYLRKKKTLGLGRKKVTAFGRSSYYFGFTFGADSISEEVAGFSPFMVSPRKNIVFIVSCV